MEIHRAWEKLGYPLDSLVPSLATSLGTSADRPAALAELLGIIANYGKRLPTVMLEELNFAYDTPFATKLRRVPKVSRQVLSPEVSMVLREALVDVVRNGTAVRLRAGLGPKTGKRYVVGGKTGTGDHRHKTFTRGGALKESRILNRTATFAFLIGDRFFGTITAFVKGPEAKKFRFTSSLPVQILKILEPALMPLIEGRSHSDSEKASSSSSSKSNSVSNT